MQNVSGYGQFQVGNTTCLIFEKVLQKKYHFRKNSNIRNMRNIFEKILDISLSIPRKFIRDEIFK